MGLIARAWEQNDIGAMQTLLAATRERGQDAFEWGYWNRLCHLDWYLPLGENLLTLPVQTPHDTPVAISPDGTRIVSSNRANSATLWDAVNGEVKQMLLGHKAPVWAVAFSPDGKRLVTGSWDTTAGVWNAQTGKQVLLLRGHTDNTDTPPSWHKLTTP